MTGKSHGERLCGRQRLTVALAFTELADATHLELGR